MIGKNEFFTKVEWLKKNVVLLDGKLEDRDREKCYDFLMEINSISFELGRFVNQRGVPKK